MKERPILSNSEMVRAILEGRKTQTRRIVKPQPVPYPGGGHWWRCDYVQSMVRVEQELQNPCELYKGFIEEVNPFGKKGDRLWVRETFGTKIRNIGGTPHESFAYKADKSDEVCYYDCNGNGYPVKWVPSIHMPRSACRIVLEITNIRIERLNDISEADAIGEGCIAESCDHARRTCNEIGCYGPHATGQFKYLWESIKGKGSWDLNPWVWVIEFKVIQNGK
ncbi:MULTISPECIES: hypothetical protein [Acinetobacter]|uniref:hypothetical protein n=1 Tax=Acinetobacter TaxID=469 RepID=UPI00070981B4|nr:MULTISPECIES: hypothetical protein [Acinetobacter]KRJ70807.1 hypothetical protein APC93_11765 [Acinetobacter pittii]MDA3462713.1 hypothetical protein [Acinetobacter sp. AOR41_HL]